MILKNKTIFIYLYIFGALILIPFHYMEKSTWGDLYPFMFRGHMWHMEQHKGE